MRYGMTCINEDVRDPKLNIETFVGVEYINVCNSKKVKLWLQMKKSGY